MHGIAVVRIAAAVVLASDLTAVAFRFPGELRFSIGAAGIGVVFWLNGLDAQSVGLGRGSRALSAADWTLCAGLWLLTIAIGLSANRLRHGFFEVGLPPRVVLEAFFWESALVLPPIEEGVYRWAVCAALLRGHGTRTCIVVSGLLSALLGWLSGSSPFEHLVLGGLLAWVFRKHGSIWLPIGLHAVANLANELLPVAVWYACGRQPLC